VNRCADPGTYYGYRIPGKFKTIMAYDCDRFPEDCPGVDARAACPVIPYFSGLQEYEGELLGGDQNNCGAQIIKFKEAMSNYR